MSRLVLALAILLIGLLLLMLNAPDGKVAGLTGDQLATLLYFLPMIALMGAGIIAARKNWSQSIRNFLVWLVIILAIATLSLFREDAKRVGARLIAGLLPGHAVTVSNKDGTREVLLSRDLSGHFSATVTVNAQPIQMLVDTGASAVVLTYEDAVQVGIIPENLTYSTRVTTANGEATVAPIDLSTVEIGPIRRWGIKALVARRGALDESLLGMSFLTTLSSFHMQTDELRLKD